MLLEEFDKDTFAVESPLPPSPKRDFVDFFDHSYHELAVTANGSFSDGVIKDYRTCPAKGTRAMLLYTAMLQQLPSECW